MGIRRIWVTHALGPIVVASILWAGLALPWFDCPVCEGGRSTLFDEDDPPDDLHAIPCLRCGDRRHLDLLERWSLKSAVAAPVAPEPPAFSLEGLTPEQMFDQLERRLVDADSIRIKFRIRYGPAEDLRRLETDGVLLVRRFDAAHLLFKTRDDEGSYWTRIVSDGSTMRRRSSRTGWTPPRRLPAAFGRGVAQHLFRIGMQPTQGAPLEGGTSIPLVSDVQSALEAPGVRTLSWTLRTPEVGQCFESTLWLDESTLRPLRRRLTTRISGELRTLDEVYEEFRLNGALPDRKFAVQD